MHISIPTAIQPSLLFILIEIVLTSCRQIERPELRESYCKDRFRPVVLRDHLEVIQDFYRLSAEDTTAVSLTRYLAVESFGLVHLERKNVAQ